MAERCFAFARSGERCKKTAQESSRYCVTHHDDYTEVESFFSKHSEHTVGFLLGVFGDTIVHDGYDWLKASLFPPQRQVQLGQGSDEVLRLVNQMLADVRIKEKRYVMAYLPWRRSDGVYGLFECRFPNESGDRGASGNGDIEVFILDELGRRKVGDICGNRVNIEVDEETIYLVSYYHAGVSGSKSYYRVSGLRLMESLDLAFEERDMERRRP